MGRSSPEIDVFEAQMGGEPLSGEVSQSAQFAVCGLVFGVFFNPSGLGL